MRVPRNKQNNGSSLSSPGIKTFSGEGEILLGKSINLAEIGRKKVELDFEGGRLNL
jgi:hypothetical protein